MFTSAQQRLKQATPGWQPKRNGSSSPSCFCFAQHLGKGAGLSAHVSFPFLSSSPGITSASPDSGDVDVSLEDPVADRGRRPDRERRRRSRRGIEAVAIRGPDAVLLLHPRPAAHVVRAVVVEAGELERRVPAARLGKLERDECVDRSGGTPERTCSRTRSPRAKKRPRAPHGARGGLHRKISHRGAHAPRPSRTSARWAAWSSPTRSVVVLRRQLTNTCQFFSSILGLSERK